MLHFGIIGNPLKQSFSAKFFTEKFLREHIDADYHLFPLSSIEEFPELCRKHEFTGLNVTIPYKQAVIPYLDELDATASAVGAVNVIKFSDNRLTGYNTDTLGFYESIRPILRPWHKKALVLGTGGAAKAVIYALGQLGINVSIVSRSCGRDYTYRQLTPEVIKDNLLIVNCTPLGMFPDTDACADIPYEALTPQHLLYDVIYNPEETLFLNKGKAQGASVCNGLGMLYGQAKEAWKIWGNVQD